MVPRFLPPRLGQVMVMYLAYLQPFQEYLTVQGLGGSFSDYVWADEQGPWGTDRLTRALRREMGKRLGVELHTLDYRHTAVGIGRVVVGEFVDRMQKRSIDCIEWKHGESSPAGVVVVSADAAGDTISNGNFLGYANMLSGKGCYGGWWWTSVISSSRRATGGRSWRC